MNRRPVLQPGDIVKLSKKVRNNHIFKFFRDKTMIVDSFAKGSTTEKNTIIKVKIKEKTNLVNIYSFIREELWFTGINARDLQNNTTSTSKHSYQYSLAHPREKQIEEAIQGLNYKGETIETELRIQDNDGREYCFKCNSPTQVVSTGFTKNYNICPKCKI